MFWFFGFSTPNIKTKSDDSIFFHGSRSLGFLLYFSLSPDFVLEMFVFFQCKNFFIKKIKKIKISLNQALFFIGKKSIKRIQCSFHFILDDYHRKINEMKRKKCNQTNSIDEFPWNPLSLFSTHYSFLGGSIGVNNNNRKEEIGIISFHFPFNSCVISQNDNDEFPWKFHS